MSDWETIGWHDGVVRILDQRRLPLEEVVLECRSVEAVARAIRDMAIRGAPAIGVAAAMGVALAAREAALGGRSVTEAVTEACRLLEGTRPTAVNLFWALRRMAERTKALAGGTPLEIAEGLVAEAQAIRAEDIAVCRALGRHGAELVPDGATVLTHCNAGALATAGYGTALGIIRAAVEQGKRIRVLADETRPVLQGARLTAWELHRDGIDVTVITEGAAGSLMARGEVDCVIVGSDRTVANGDVCNKIGTYPLAVLANRHGVPFYAAVPTSTIDRSLPSGDAIPIEERPGTEVACFAGVRTVPEGVPVRNPAFDVTPAALVSAIVTERGVVRPPYLEGIARLFADEVGA